ncbi:photosystem reaction center subunit H [Modestobacter sp. VKM Ac-2676]|nr:photosystem reaction center subunit H [Modestobacter sp. VKM Ac-2676]
MIGTDTLDRVIGADVYDASGDKIGTASEVYLDDQSGNPEWVTVKTGLFGTKESFVPIADADLTGDGVRVPVTKSQVKDAPKIDTDGHLSPEEEQELYRYYGTTRGTATTDTTRTETVGTADTNRHGTVGHDTSGPTTDDAMTLSEERVNVGTRKEETGRARLRKYVVTENVTETVPVSHEEVRIEREPITDANRGKATDGPAISEEEHEVTLHAERPVVEKEAVPVERVRMDTETVTDQQQVNETVRKEQVDTDEVTDTNRR